MRKYKVHHAYISSNGVVVKEGIYGDTEINIPEARNKTVVTLVDISDVYKTTSAPDIVKELKLNITDTDTIAEIKLVPNIEVKEGNFFNINEAEEAAISALKYVSKANAKKVVEQRIDAPFKSYPDLDARVRLTGGRSWEDIAAIIFTANENKVQLDLA